MAGKYVQAPARQWVEVYAATGFAVGSSLLIQNQTSMTFSLIEQADSPEPNAPGRWLYPGFEAEAINSPPGIWIRSDQPVSAYVQELG